MNDISGKRLLGGSCVGASKYRWLVLKIQEYPVNKELLTLTEQDIGPSGAALGKMPGGLLCARPTERRALRIAELRRRIEEVETALKVVPEEYREGILFHTLNHGSKAKGVGAGSAWADSMFDGAHRNTWSKWKARFILEYADIIGEGEYVRMLREYGSELDAAEKM